MGRGSRLAASDISWDKIAEIAERDLEIKTRRGGRDVLFYKTIARMNN